MVHIFIMYPKLVSWAWDQGVVKLFNGVKNVHQDSKLKRIKEKV